MIKKCLILCSLFSMTACHGMRDTEAEVNALSSQGQSVSKINYLINRGDLVKSLKDNDDGIVLKEKYEVTPTEWKVWFKEELDKNNNFKPSRTIYVRSKDV